MAIAVIDTNSSVVSGKIFKEGVIILDIMKDIFEVWEEVNSNSQKWSWKAFYGGTNHRCGGTHKELEMEAVPEEVTELLQSAG